MRLLLKNITELGVYAKALKELLQQLQIQKWQEEKQRTLHRTENNLTGKLRTIY